MIIIWRRGFDGFLCSFGLVKLWRDSFFIKRSPVFFAKSEVECVLDLQGIVHTLRIIVLKIEFITISFKSLASLTLAIISNSILGLYRKQWLIENICLNKNIWWISRKVLHRVPCLRLPRLAWVTPSSLVLISLVIIFSSTGQLALRLRWQELIQLRSWKDRWRSVCLRPCPSKSRQVCSAHLLIRWRLRLRGQSSNQLRLH